MKLWTNNDDNGNVTDNIESVQATSKDANDNGNVTNEIESVQATTKDANDDGNVADEKVCPSYFQRC